MRFLSRLLRWWTITCISTNYGVPYKTAERAYEDCDRIEHKARSRLHVCRMFNRRYEDCDSKFWNHWERRTSSLAN